MACCPFVKLKLLIYLKRNVAYYLPRGMMIEATTLVSLFTSLVCARGCSLLWIYSATFTYHHCKSLISLVR